MTVCFNVFMLLLLEKWIGTKQSEFQLNALQLLFYQAPLSALLLAFTVPLFEPLLGEKGALNLIRPPTELVSFFIPMTSL